MAPLWEAHVAVPLVTIAFNVGLAYWISTRHADIRGSRWFVVVLVLGTCWMAATVLQLSVVDEGLRFAAYVLATKFMVWSILGWIVFASKYAHADFHKHWLARVVLVALFLPSLLPTFDEPLRGLMYRSVEFPTDPFPYVVADRTALFSALAILTAITVAYALFELVRYMLSTPRRSGLQLALLVLGALSIQVAVVLENLGLGPVDGMTYSAYGALPFVGLTTVALFRFRLFEVTPVARNAVVENLRDPLIVLDRDRTIVDYNPASTAIWPGIEESVGQPLAAACPNLAAELTVSDDEVSGPDRVNLSVDGRQVYSLTVSPVRADQDGPVELYTVLLRDVTDLERSKWQLARQNERLEQVAATISHDLRNPISVADGSAAIIADLLEEETLSGEDRQQARRNVARIRDAHERMTEIIDDVLALAREGKAVERADDVSLSPVARDAWDNVETASATLTVATDRGLAADRSKLLRLLENLFRNAVEHGSTSPRSPSAHGDAVEHGSTSPPSQAREDAVEHGGDEVAVTVGATDDGFYVQDDGPGIPADHRNDVFEYGYTTTEGGTGLGLSIVRMIAESHGWSVALDEESASGARFVFRNVDAGPVADRDGDGGQATGGRESTCE